MSTENEVQAAIESARAEVIRKNRAFAAVFGEEGKRTTPQLIVWKELSSLGFERKSTVRYTNQGAIDPMQLAVNQGLRDFFLFIRETVAAATAEPSENKVTVSK